jgi:flavodoxin
MGNDSIRKAFKIILVIFAVLIIIVAAVGAVFFLDVSALKATGSRTLTPTGPSVGNAMVVYDPGLSGTAKGVADKIASDLQTQGYTVQLAGIKSSTATQTTGYNTIGGFSIVVAGGPIYAGSPTSSVKDFLNNLKPSQGVKVGVFGSGSGSTAPEDVAQIRNSVGPLQSGGSLANAVVVKIGQNEDLNARASDFVTQLLH